MNKESDIRRCDGCDRRVKPGRVLTLGIHDDNHVEHICCICHACAAALLLRTAEAEALNTRIAAKAKARTETGALIA
jgi:hypothetical protein